MADILSLEQARARREAEQAKPTSQKFGETSKKFDEVLTDTLAIWRLAVKSTDERAQDEQLKALVNFYLERCQLKIQDVGLDEVSRIEQALELRLMIHYPKSIVTPNFTNSGFTVITVNSDKGMWWSTPPFTAERYARWFNIILYLTMLEASLA